MLIFELLNIHIFDHSLNSVEFGNKLYLMIYIRGVIIFGLLNIHIFFYHSFNFVELGNK